jgi:hypothetical protein
MASNDEMSEEEHKLFDELVENTTANSMSEMGEAVGAAVLAFYRASKAPDVSPEDHMSLYLAFMREVMLRLMPESREEGGDGSGIVL